ncbi:MAG: hypothetical protein K8R88_11980, partial [Armatimonadetes bacterium]|nr:hypothetical protein [Armatimonadota bacterium]
CRSIQLSYADALRRIVVGVEIGGKKERVRTPRRRPGAIGRRYSVDQCLLVSRAARHEARKHATRGIRNRGPYSHFSM